MNETNIEQMAESEIFAEWQTLTKKLSTGGATVAEARRCEALRGALDTIKRARKGAAAR